MIDKYLLPFFMTALAFFAPTGPFILLMGFIIFVDMVIAILCVRKEGGEIQSRKLARTVGKFLVYGLAILTAHVVSKFFFPSFPALQLIAGFITFVELKSIDENIKRFTGHSMFGALLDKLKPKKDKNERQ